MKFLNKIRALPEKKRKIIFWFLVCGIGFLLFFFYIKDIPEKLKSIDLNTFKKEIQVDKFKAELKKVEIPKIDLPVTNHEEK